jgi:hypothetical protein
LKNDLKTNSRQYIIEKMSTTKKCQRCKRELILAAFFYREKDHTICHPCAETRVCRKHICEICGRNGVFNKKEEKFGRRCKEHAEPDMIDVKNRKCQCGKRPNFNFPGQDVGICCAGCKKSGMVDVKNRKCKCGKQPTFNFTGQNIGICCAECKIPGMVDVNHKKCKCGKIPVYNFLGQDTAICCTNCKEPGMVNVKSKKCKCGKIPSFNFPGQDIAICCANCKKPNMVDVISRKCTYPNCKTRARYGLPHNFPSHCSQHRQEGMIVNPRAKCKKHGCKELAQYGLKTPIHCYDHRNANDIDLCERICSKCGKLDIVLNGICVNFCLKEEEMAAIYRKNQKEHENRLAGVLKANFEPPHQHDKKLEDAQVCDIKSRPDFLWDFGTHIVIVECDESQHSSNCFEGEQKRMINIWSVLGGIPTIFIRYNPDNYIAKRGKKESLVKREDILVRWLKKLRSEPPQEKLQVLYLFYDGYSPETTRLHKIDIDNPIYCKFNDKIFLYQGFLDAYLDMDLICPQGQIVPSEAGLTDKPHVVNEVNECEMKSDE